MEGTNEKLEPQSKWPVTSVAIKLLFYLTLQIFRSCLLMIVNSDTLFKAIFSSSQPPFIFVCFCFLFFMSCCLIANVSLAPTCSLPNIVLSY